METNNNKLYGIYDNEVELQQEMDRLRTQGYADDDMYIVSKHNGQLSMYHGSADIVKDAPQEEGSWWDRFKAFMMGDDLVRNQHFTQMGIPEEDRDRYYGDLEAGKFLLYVDRDYGHYFDESSQDVANHPHDTAATPPIHEDTPTNRVGTEEERMALHEEQLEIEKNRVKTGEVQVDKHVVEEERIVEVPVEREEVYIERRPVNETTNPMDPADPITGDTTPYENDGKIHIPVSEEQIEVTKKDVVAEEIVVGKRKVMDTERVAETVRREEADIKDSTNPLHNDTDPLRNDKLND